MQSTRARTVALCYARKSDVRVGADLVSIDIQRAAIAAECSWRGWTPEWYEDADGHRSGRREDGRPQFLKLKTRLGDSDVAAVVGYRLDRISRSVKDFVSLVESCREKGVAIVTADKQIDTSGGLSAFATVQLNLLAAVAQFESDAASDRLREHVARKSGAGITHGRPPFGMSRVGRGLDARFDQNADFPAVLRCLALYASGLSYDATAATLNAEGTRFRARAGHPTKWGREAVRTVVGNVLFYAGYFAAEGWDAKNSRITLAGEGDHLERYARAVGAVVSPAIVPAVDRLLANSVIERREKNQVAGRRGAAPFLLTPIAWWNGKKLRGQNTPTGRFYSTRGSGPWIAADQAEEDVLALLDGLQFPPELRALIHAQALADVSPEKLEALQKAIRDGEAAQALLFDLLKERRITREHYAAEWDRAAAQVAAARTELERPTEVDAVLRQLADLGATIRFMTPEARKRNILRIFERIDLDGEGAVVSVRMRPPAERAFGVIRATMPLLPKVGTGDNVGMAPRLVSLAA